MPLLPITFSQTIDKPAYLAARRVAAAKTGVLRYRAPMTLLMAALGIGGVVTLLQNPQSAGYLLTGIVMICLAAMLVAVWFWLLPRRVQTAAQADFASYDLLTNGAQVTLRADDFLIQSAILTRENSYARMRLCVETADRFVLIGDDWAMVVLEKRCFADAEKTTAFLREVFARKYVRSGRL